jgi:hypothetical protein
MNKDILKKVKAKLNKQATFNIDEIDQYLKKSIKLPMSSKSTLKIFRDGAINWISPVFKGDKSDYRFMIDKGSFIFIIGDKTGIKNSTNIKSFNEGFKKIEEMETGKKGA